MSRFGSGSLVPEILPARSQFGCYVAKSLLHDDRVDAREALSRIQAGVFADRVQRWSLSMWRRRARIRCS